MDGEPAAETLGGRVDRLQGEVGALREEVAALRAAAMQRVSAPMAGGESRAVQPVLGTAQAAVPAQANESLESRLGTAVLSKIAVVLLLVGVAWFLKWAFDNRWIGPVGRVVAGLLVGVGVILWSERFRQQQLVGFSYALKAVGSGVLYLSLWASVQLYHLAPAPVAFAAMVAVTAWNAAMAWSQDAPLLAGYALLGAYLTPLLLRTGGDHEAFLFSYLAAIAAALLVLLRVKPWSRLLLGALPATAAFFIAWYAEFFDAAKGWRTAGFVLLLWAVFAAVPLLAVEAESAIAGVLEPLGAGVLGAVAIYSVLADSGGQEWEWVGAVGFALVYFALSAGGLAAVGRRGAVAAHPALGVAFVTAAIALKATGPAMTAAWLVEAVVLLAVGFWQRSALARWLGLVLLGAAVVKTFAWDMRNLGTGFRVVSCLGLGVLLMVVSFAYQKDWLGLPRTKARDQPKPESGEANA